MAPRPLGNDKSLNVQISPDLHAFLVAEAAEEGVSMAHYLRVRLGNLMKAKDEKATSEAPE